MIDLDPLGLDEAVRKAVEGLEEEIEVRKYADKGQNGHLFFGEHRILGRRVAVKFYYWAHTRTHDEPRLLSSLESDHVIPVYSARFVDDEWAMFQTPYYPRGDLDQVAQTTRLSLHQALDHAIEILVGVSALHAAQLIHRDLKPENIFIDDEGRARIGDFGSVIALPTGAQEVDGSGHSQLYRPPESFATGRYGRAGDLYQCGVVLYQLLGGALPYEASAWLDREARGCLEKAADDFERSQCVEASLARAARRQRLLDLDTLPGTVPNALKTIIRRATKPDPESRQESTSQFIHEIRGIRSSSKDWLWTGHSATARCSDRRVRIVPHRDGTFRCEADRGKGWRRMPGLDPASVRDLAQHVDRNL